MPRSAFIRDARDLAETTRKLGLECVGDVQFNYDTEELSVPFKHADGSTVTLCILCGDLDAYPDARHYFISTTDSSPSHDLVTSSLQQKLQTTNRSLKLLEVVLKALKEFGVANINSDESGRDDAKERTGSEESDLLEVDANMRAANPASVLGTKRHHSEQSHGTTSHSLDTPSGARRLAHPRNLPLPSSAGHVDQDEGSAPTGAGKARIARDLKAVCDAGFFFGVIDGMEGQAYSNNVVAVSAKIATLGLPLRFLLTWDLDPTVYLVLLIRCRSGYVAHEQLLQLTNREPDLSFRIGTCPNYKPSAKHALGAFGLQCPQSTPAAEAGSRERAAAFSKIMVSSEMEQLMSNSFSTLVRIHDVLGKSWAEALSLMPTQPGLDSRRLKELSNPSSSEAKSLPLAAMEFAIDRIRTYTQYCQSCYAKLDSGLQTFKPSICSRALCRYQFMQVGQTQHLEYQFMSQPAVVDLLINLFYIALYSSINSPRETPIREFPSCPRLLVPNLDVEQMGYFKPLDELHFSIVLANGMQDGQFEKGQWLTVASTCRRDGHMINLRQACVIQADSRSSTLYMSSALPLPLLPAKCYIFPHTRHIQDVHEKEKAAVLLCILMTIPSVEYIRSQLLSPLVSQLRDIRGLSRSAIALLEWIMETNRSCIVQLTNPQLTVHESHATCPGPPENFLQFCFCHGSPESEAEFGRQLALCAWNGQLPCPACPTLLAWHGSSLKNWHSILRSGLDYQNIANGRTYGNGVYFSRDFSVSLDFAAEDFPQQWPNAVTNLLSVMSLNEIINAPQYFVSQTPHYVVQYANWSRFRYLFVGSNSTLPASWPHSQNTDFPLATGGYFFQDPTRVVKGPLGAPMMVPLASMPARAFGAVASNGSAVADTAVRKDLAVATMDSRDLAYLEAAAAQPEVYSIGSGGDSAKPPNPVDNAPIQTSDKTDDCALQPAHKKVKLTTLADADVTPFVPGRLDHSSLRSLPRPSWGTASAQRVLALSLRSLQRTQATTPLPHLGWYVDFDRVENLFQWVVELHSFDNKIPLANDMRLGNINSIVMEMRFGPDYPMTPPLVRVVRPQFLSLMQGGGGHVTAGGAICMELLTGSGWLPTCDIASVLLHIHLALSTAVPPARLNNPLSPDPFDYDIGQAMEGYLRSAATHGWSVPADMQIRAKF